MAADSSSSNDDCTKFKTALGSDELSRELDAERYQLVIKLANASHFMVHR